MGVTQSFLYQVRRMSLWDSVNRLESRTGVTNPSESPRGLTRHRLLQYAFGGLVRHYDLRGRRQVTARDRGIRYRTGPYT